MSLPSIGSVGSQFSQISGLNPRDLISNYFGDYLYPRNSCMGYVWSCFYGLHNSVASPGLEEQNLTSAIRCTDELFEQHLKRIRPYESHYRDFIEGKTIIPFEVDTTRQELFQFYEATSDYYYPLYLPMIEVESLTKTPFPVLLIKKCKFPLESSEERELDFWIKTVNQANVPVRSLHGALNLVVGDPLQVEAVLQERGLRLSSQIDFQHVAWRGALKEGDSVLCNKRRVTLGKRLGTTAVDIDNHVYFEIDKGLLLIGINCTVPGALKEANAKAWGVVPASILEVDAEGKCAIVERLALPIKSLKWSSNSPDITNEDKKQAKPLLNWFKWLKDEGFVPDKFDPKYFMIDQKGVLRSTKPMSRKPYTLESVEDFVRDMTRYNDHITNYFCRFLTV